MKRTAVLLLFVSVFIGTGGLNLNFPRNYVSSLIQGARRMVSGNSNEATTELTSTTPTNHRIVCVKDGMYRNPENCSTFIHCSNGKPYLKKCPRGLHFSFSRQRCEWPCEAYCDETLACECHWASCDEQVCRLPVDAGTCKEFKEYYSFDYRRGRCRAFDYGGCKGNSNRFKTLAECERKCLRNLDVSTISSQQHVIQSKYSCVKDGLFKNPQDCSSFVECSSGFPVLMHCPLGLHFGVELQRCVAPCTAKCDDNKACECGWDTCDSEFCQLPAVRGPCRGHFKRYYFDFNDGRCKSFVYGGCKGNRNNFETRQECYDTCSEQYNDTHKPQFQTEDPKTFTENLESGPWSPLLPRTFREYWTSTDVLESQTWTSTEPSWPAEDAAFEFRCDQDGKFVVPETCTAYAECSNGRKTRIMCPDNTHFNRLTGSCEDPCIARCDSSLADLCGWHNPNPTVSERMQTEDGEQWRNDIYANPSENSRLWNPNSPPISLEYSDYDQTSATKYKCIMDGAFPNPDDCASFIQCTSYRPLVRSCPPNLHFNPDTMQCDTICNAHCDQSYACRCNWTDDCGDSDNFICLQDGLFRNPSNCSSFIHCSDGRPILQMCPGGLHFSVVSRRCEWPCEAHCNKTLACDCGWPECDRKADCDAEPESGACEGFYPRYFYDKESGECERFAYKGCGGNSNNFKSKEDCVRECKNKLIGNFKCPTPNGKYGDYFDCTMYFQCENDSVKLKRCPRGMAFDHLLGKCVTEYEAKCVYNCHSKDAVYPYPLDNHKYIDCINGISKVEKCPNAEVFDAEERNCIPEYPIWDE